MTRISRGRISVGCCLSVAGYDSRLEPVLFCPCDMAPSAQPWGSQNCTVVWSSSFLPSLPSQGTDQHRHPRPTYFRSLLLYPPKAFPPNKSPACLLLFQHLLFGEMLQRLNSQSVWTPPAAGDFHTPFLAHEKKKKIHWPTSLHSKTWCEILTLEPMKGILPSTKMFSSVKPGVAVGQTGGHGRTRWLNMACDLEQGPLLRAASFA